MVKENLRILVVDDEKDYCEVLKMILENNGYVVETCFNGKEDVYKRQPYDSMQLKEPRMHQCMRTDRLHGTDSIRVYRY